MTCDEQLKLWAAGKSVHNPTRDECCPDFSCCRPELAVSLHERRRFVAADKARRDSMLVKYLVKMLRKSDFVVSTSRITGKRRSKH